MVIGQQVTWPVIHSFIDSVCLSVVSLILLVQFVSWSVNKSVSLSVSRFVEFSQSFSIGTC